MRLVRLRKLLFSSTKARYLECEPCRTHVALYRQSSCLLIHFYAVTMTDGQLPFLAPLSTPPTSAFDAIRYRHQACITCRRGKLRCDLDSDVPCQRCRTAGIACLFDETTARKRTTHSQRPAKRQKLQTLSNEISALKDTIASLDSRLQPSLHADVVEISPSGRLEQDGGDSRAGATTTHSNGADKDVTDGYHDLSAESLASPAIAVHVLMHPPRRGEPERYYTA